MFWREIRINDVYLLMESHGALGLLRDGVPAGGPVAPVAGPLVLVAPRVPHADQVHLVPPAAAHVHAVQPRYGVGVALIDHVLGFVTALFDTLYRLATEHTFLP